MRRMIDWRCECGRVEADVLADEDEIAICPDCHVAMQQDWLPRVRHDAQWDDNTAVMILVNNDPNCPSDVKVRYPGSHNCRVPIGYERVYLRSLSEVNRFEREHGVTNHVMHYDNNGRAIDDKFRDERLTH